jgi:hypothetical protein
MKNILMMSLVIILSLSSCKKHHVEVSMYIDITYKDSMGNDLLNTGTKNHFISDSIHIYDIVNGTKKEVNYPNNDYPHNFFIYKNDSLKEYFIKVFLETNTTFLQLSQSITDTITSVIDVSDGNHVITKVWYNGVLCKQNYFGIAREFTITK